VRVNRDKHKLIFALIGLIPWINLYPNLSVNLFVFRFIRKCVVSGHLIDDCIFLWFVVNNFNLKLLDSLRLEEF
jgi:hypothetical protein